MPVSAFKLPDVAKSPDMTKLPLCDRQLVLTVVNFTERDNVQPNESVLEEILWRSYGCMYDEHKIKDGDKQAHFKGNVF